MVPTNFVHAIRANSISYSSSGTAAVVTTSPSASSVEVRAPNEMSATYPLRSSVRRPKSFVASPIPTTSTPLALGSSVPACPTRFSPNTRRTRETTSWLVKPSGLSTAISALIPLAPRFTYDSLSSARRPMSRGTISVNTSSIVPSAVKPAAAV